MEWRTWSDPSELPEAVHAHLAEAPLFNQLQLALVSPQADARRYPEIRVYGVTEGSRVVGVVTHTPPWRPALSRMAEAAAAFAGDHFPPCSEVFGELGAAEAFARSAARGGRAWRAAGMGLFELQSVEPVRPADGTMRPAVPGDAALLQTFLQAFHDEAVPTDPQPGPADGERMANSGRSRLWEVNGRAVAWAHSARVVAGRWPSIGPVYSLPEGRGRGYGTSLVAAFSTELLAGGAAGCTLFTDLDNPTSNAIYERIGYRRIGTMARMAWELPR